MKLKESLKQVSILGIKSINEDFRLRKIYEKVKALSSKAPVMAKISSMLENVINGDSEDIHVTVCELTNLINAVLYTQGKCTSSEKEEEIHIVERKNNIKTLRFSQLSAIREILSGGTTTKWASLKTAFNEGKLIDYRLLQDFLNELSNTYTYEENFNIVTILSAYGEDIVPFLLERFHNGNKTEKASIIKIISNGAKEKYNEFYKKCVLEEEQDNVISAAINALRHDTENEQFLLDLKFKKKKLKDARVYALAHMPGEKAHEEVVNICLKDEELLKEIFNSINFLSYEEIITMLKALITELKEEKFTEKELKSRLTMPKKYRLFYRLVECLGTYKNNEVQEMLKEIIESKVEVLSGSREAALQLYYQNDENSLRYLAGIKDKFDYYYLQISFMAALEVYSKEEIYDEFSSLINVYYKDDSITLQEILKNIQHYCTHDYSYVYYNEEPFVNIPSFGGYAKLYFNKEKIKEWDDRWFKYLVDNEINELSAYFMPDNLDDTSKDKIKNYYSEKLKEFLKMSSRNYKRNSYIDNAIWGLIKTGGLTDVIELAKSNFLQNLNQFIYTKYLSEEDIPLLKTLADDLETEKRYNKYYIETLDKYIQIIKDKNNK